MAALIELDPAPSTSVGEVDFAVTEAARTNRGITATVIARNDRTLHSDEVRLARPASRAAFAEHMATEHGLDRAEVEAALLELLVAVEGAARQPRRPARPGGNQAAVLLEAAGEAELFHTPSGVPHATVPATAGSHRETHKVRSPGFRQWLSHRYFQASGGAPGGQAVQDALGVIDARARFDGPEHPVFVRVAERAGEVVIDLGTQDRSVVVVTPEGWRVEPVSPVRFIRAGGTAPLSVPVRGGRVDDLRRFLNVASDDDFALLLGWLVSAFRESGPKPLLVLNGEQGSAKSSTARVLRRLIDPNTSPLRSEPRDVRELMISAANAWVLCYDNMSFIEGWLSDALCRLSTGGGFSARELYSDTEEVLFEARRPVIVNGIDELATRSDLLDRAVLVNLPVIPAGRRRGEAELWAEFEREQPRVFGALLTAVATGLRREPQVRLPSPPRLADFARWAVAAEPGLGLAGGQFLSAYEANRGAAHELALEASVIGPWVQRLVATSDFCGTAAELLRRLGSLARAEQGGVQPRGWPRTPKMLSDQLRRLRPNLPSVGITVDFDRTPDRMRTRIVTIRNTAWSSQRMVDSRKAV